MSHGSLSTVDKLTGKFSLHDCNFLFDKNGNVFEKIRFLTGVGVCDVHTNVFVLNVRRYFKSIFSIATHNCSNIDYKLMTSNTIKISIY